MWKGLEILVGRVILILEANLQTIPQLYHHQKSFDTQYSLWETIVFPPDIDYHIVNVEHQFKLLQKTLGKYWESSALDGDAYLRMMRIDLDEDIYIDLYVMNPDDSRVKIQVVTVVNNTTRKFIFIAFSSTCTDVIDMYLEKSVKIY
jgi:hypothetical protein